jgi:class 3 adenylate cyclase
MDPKTFYYSWELNLKSSPEALWQFVADTNRFNRDVGLSPVEQLGVENGIRRMRFKLPIAIEWDENPFEWTYPYRFGILRSYSKGPLKKMRVLCELTPQPQGTKLKYQVWASPANLLGYPFISFGIGFMSARNFRRVFERYDALASSGKTIIDAPGAVQLSSGGVSRLSAARSRLLDQGCDPDLIDRLIRLLSEADDLSLVRMRPFALADYWNVSRRSTLELFLRAARLGVLNIRWEMICPMCRGAADSAASLREIHAENHCASCAMDFEANFDLQVEAIFHPNESIRKLSAEKTFCVDSPVKENSFKVMQTIPAQDRVSLSALLEPGDYTLMSAQGSVRLKVTPNGQDKVSVALDRIPEQEIEIAAMPTIEVINPAASPADVVVQQNAWDDQIATAADVTSLQLFRDLFSDEALRPGEELGIGAVTILFTDLRDSTKLYLQIGDAPAFGRVREHFEILEQAIAAQGGAVVKTMGDAVMAVFREPVAALKAVRGVQSRLAERNDPMLWLKVGIHQGACIAVNLNDRLDYFGSTVNIASRLPGLSRGGELILSDAVRNDPEVRALLQTDATPYEAFRSNVKGFDEPFELWRIKLS